MRPRTLVGRLIAWQVAVVIVLLAALGFVLDRSLARESVESLTESLASQARTIRSALPDEGASMQTEAVRLGRAGGLRITLIAADGDVLADSERDPTGLENHRDRPEVREALGGAVGTDQRRSESVGQELLYVALPPESGRIVRVAYPLERVRAQQGVIRWTIVLGLVAAAIAATGGVLLVSRGVVGPLRRMTRTLEERGEGLPPRLAAGGTEELQLLARTLNAMTERVEAEMLSVEDGRRTRDLILSSMEEGVLLAAPDGTVTFANRAVEAHLGTRPATLGALLPMALRTAAERAGANGGPAAVEVETGTPARWLRCAFVPVDPDGALLLVVRDVTQARRLENVRRDFVTNASHELKTPVASIQAAAETIVQAAADDPEVVPRFAARVEREALRLSRIVSDLLDLSRLESGSEPTDPVDLGRVVREESERFGEAATAAGVTLTVDADPPVRIRGSERDLRALVRNLVDNAVRYTGEGGRIDVRLASDDGAAVLRVSDTGIGIPSRDLPRVFERFYRVDRARSRETGGTGLGLAIVRHVAENHGGSVEVDSELGRGTTFEVRLPSG
jgi:two-component system phosphate regulon sensor histidine kinase PhoR